MWPWFVLGLIKLCSQLNNSTRTEKRELFQKIPEISQKVVEMAFFFIFKNSL